MFSFPGLQRVPAHMFGRRQPFTYELVDQGVRLTLPDDARLFLTTFFGGLLFMTIYLG